MSEEQKHTAGRDPLTGLEGYDACLTCLEALAARGNGDSAEFSLGLVDIDWFAKLNEEYGHAAGDGVLAALAGFLEEEFPAPAAVFRFGGDAFAVVLDDTEKERAFLLLEQARAEFTGERRVPVAGGETLTLDLSVTVGIASSPDDGTLAADIVRKANEAVYRAKVGGRNKVCLAREEKMVTKTSHYTQGQLHGLSRLAKREGLGEAVLLREALDDLLRKYNTRE